MPAFDRRGRPRGRGRRPSPDPSDGTPVEVTVERLGAGGDGIAEHAGQCLFIPLSVPGDRLRVRVGERRGEGRAAEILAVRAPGPDRAQPPCPHFGACGGCALQHVAEDAYATWKVERLRRALARAGFEDYPLAPLIRTAPGTRRRARLAARCLAQGRVVLGFKARRGHTIIDVASCPLLAPAIEALLPALRQLLARVLAVGQETDVTVTALDLGLDVVLDFPIPPTLAVREALAAFAAASDLARLSWRRDATAPAEPVAERRPACVTIAGVPVAIPPGGFLQPSREGEAALQAAVKAAVGGAPVVADLFAGIGTFALPLAVAGARVLAIEDDAGAVVALTRAARHHLPRLSCQRRDLFQKPLAAAELAPFAAVVLDPPRAGALAQAKELAASPVPVVASVSCHPETFARDARVLAQGGFRLALLTPIDQFLWSPHLEVVAVFRR